MSGSAAVAMVRTDTLLAAGVGVWKPDTAAKDIKHKENEILILLQLFALERRFN
jgi:hypothetical protein